KLRSRFRPRAGILPTFTFRDKSRQGAATITDSDICRALRRSPGGYTVSMRTRTHLALGFGLVIALLVVLSVMNLTRINQLGGTVEDLASSRVPRLVAGGKVIETLLQSARQMRDVLVLDDEAQVKREIAGIRRNSQLTKVFLDQIEKTLRNQSEIDVFRTISEARAQYLPHEEEFLKNAERGDYSSAKDVMLQRVRGAQAQYIELISTFIENEAAGTSA